MSTTPTPQGRLGNPSLDLSHDPRTHPDLKKALDAVGLGANASQGIPPEAVNVEAMNGILEQVNEKHIEMYKFMDLSNAGDELEAEVEESEMEIEGVDGNKIKLYVTRPKGVSGKLPGVVYIHGMCVFFLFSFLFLFFLCFLFFFSTYVKKREGRGRGRGREKEKRADQLVPQQTGGAMTVIPTKNRAHDRWCKSLALQGLVVIMIDFRNAWTKAQHNPFPTGLNDCVAGVKWIASQKSSLGIHKFILQGESGGANLSLAVALRANRERWVHEIAGVYGYVPYISGGYGWSRERKLKETPSQLENEDYMLNASAMAAMAWYYSPEGDKEDPLAWPYHASEQDLKGLPPHAISVDELDPLRDEGIAYYHKLTHAGVQATCEINLGVIHASAVVFRHALPAVARKQVALIAAFAKSL